MGGGHIHHYPPCVVVVVVVATSPDIFSDFFYFIPHLATVLMSYNYLELLGLDLAHLNY